MHRVGFRRAGFLLGNGSDASNTGIQTFHWSIHLDSSRPLNLTHVNLLFLYLTYIFGHICELDICLGFFETFTSSVSRKSHV